MQQSGNQYYQKWRSALDLLARISVVTGGMGVIAAVVMIFFYLLYVVFPLFLPASAKQLHSYALPEATIGKTLLLDMEEQNQLAARFTDNGQVIFFDVATGKTVLTDKVKLPSDATITSFAQASPVNSGAVVYGLSNGKAVIVKQEYGVSFNNNVRTIQPSLLYPLGEEALVVDESGAKLEQITAQLGEESTTLAAKTAEHIRLVSFEKEQSLFADEASLKRTDGVLTLPGEGVTRLLIDKDGQQLFVVSANGRVASYDVRDKTAPSLKQAVNVVPSDQHITAINFLNGDLSLMVGDSTGLVTQWSQVRNEQNRSSFEKIREFKVSDKAVTQIFSEQRRKGFIIADALGNFGIYHSTSEKQLITERAANQLTAMALAPRANALLVETGDNQIQFWQLDNEHPEVSIKSLWQSVWYESYAKPDYIWQSSASNNDFEPKYSFVPLVFGTLKAAFYAMLVAIPMALMGAIYTAYFMAPGMRQIVKPSIEIMGALPTVILGFLAGLWLAPFIEEHLAGIFTFLLFLPVVILLFAYYWQYMPKALLAKKFQKVAMVCY
ncbi:phosphate ABC transporter permease [Methylocucumis oryzae]|uniref:phosphate ABC transporter permease n=1 Tax=Methylocucumis oryzae TaxID=1632867 RepID=UPI000698822D|nr:phosphate ABC transporter permease [Methylocucumis oryzae]